MFSLGMVICAIFNNGKALIQAQNSPSAYLKQLELVSQQGSIKSRQRPSN
jgi:SCY1-like protein 2